MGNNCCSVPLDPIEKSMRLSGSDEEPRRASVGLTSSSDTSHPTAPLTTSTRVPPVPVVGQSMRTAPPRVSPMIRTDGQELASVRPALQQLMGTNNSGTLRPASLMNSGGGPGSSINSQHRTSITSPNVVDGKSPLGRRQVKASAFTSSLVALSIPATPLAASNPLSPSGTRPIRAVGGEVHELPTFAPRQLNPSLGGSSSFSGQQHVPDGSSTTSASFASSSLTNRRYDHAATSHVGENDEDEDDLSFPCSPGSQRGNSATPQPREDTSSRVSFRDHALVLGDDADGLGSSGSDGDEQCFYQQQQQQQQQQNGNASGTSGRRSSNAIAYFDNRSGGGSQLQQRSRLSSLPSMEGSVNSSTTESFSVSSAVSLASSMCEEMGLIGGSVTGFNTLAVPLVDDGNIGKGRHSRQIARKRKHQQRSLSRASSSAGSALQRIQPPTIVEHQMQPQQQHQQMQFTDLPVMFCAADSAMDRALSGSEGILLVTLSSVSGEEGCDGIVVDLLPPVLPSPATVAFDDTVVEQQQQPPHSSVPQHCLDARSPPCYM